jgi:DNA polymerase-3 subunit alpha
VIITPEALTSLVPVSTARDSEMLVTQFDNSVVESAGMLKMDFLGLTTLTIIKTALKNIKKRHGVEIDIDAIPLDDKKTFQLYQRGETTGTFQFESEGMQNHLKGLKPDKLADLIAMNALYRPGPMEYIPNFIARKSGKEPIKYDLPIMEEFLEDTYGITVYQEQVMLLSQRLANFSKGDADVLRKAMGKKQKEVLDKMKDQFIAGCKSNGHDERVAEKIWKDWEAFAQYAFNKSHSTCYSLVAYQTAYLKANYPAEYMAAVLTHSQNNLDKVTFFIEECRKQNIEVLGPHINESGVFFEVNKNGEIRFGLGAIKGAGEAAVESIIKERESKGHFKDIFEFATRVNQRAVNKKTLECLALSGAFDCFPDFHRRQFVYAKDGDITLTEKLTRYATKMQQELESAQVNMFGGSSGTEMPLPKVDVIEPFSEIEKLHFEKEVVGVYISGHPLDNFKFEMDAFCNTSLSQLAELEGNEGRETKVGGIVASVEHRMTKTGKPFGKMILEDYSGRFEFMMWSEDYLKYKSFLMPGLFLFVEGNILRKAWGDQSLEFKIRNIDLLNELGLKRTKGLQLKMDTASISSEMITQIEELCNEFSGDCPLFLRLQDDKENINLELLSRKYRVRPINDMVKKIKKIQDLQVDVVF